MAVQWVDRGAAEIETVGPFGVYRGLEVSPDGKRVAVHRHDGTGGDIWVMEPPPRAPTRITFDAKHDNSSPIWSPERHRRSCLRRSATASGACTRRAPTDPVWKNCSWNRNCARRRCRGRRTASISSTGCRIRRRPATCGCCRWMGKSGRQKAENRSHSSRRRPTRPTRRFQQDGKWIAYTSNLTGRKEVWVRHFPTGLGQWQISPDANPLGGDWPRWNKNSKELFYHSVDVDHYRDSTPSRMGSTARSSRWR